MTAPPAPHVQVAGLSVSLGSRRVLTELSCELKRGTFVGLVGPNGSGKSTLLKAIMGLLQSTGAIGLDGEDLLAIPHKQRARRIAYLAQDSEVVWPIAVEDLVMLGRSPHRSGFAPPQAADVDAVDRAIREMDLEAFRKRSARELSGGERARVLIARVLAQDTAVVLADEPTAGLDPEHQIALMEVFRRLAGQGRTVLASLHDLALAAQWCDQLLLLDRGRIVAAGQPDEVLTPDALASVYRVRAHFGTSAAGPLVVPIAYEGLSKNADRWAHGVAFCMPAERATMSQRTTLSELGPDAAAVREEDRGAVLFDLGLSALGGSCRAVDFCIRTSDAALIDTLRSVAGRSLFEHGNPAMGAILASHPHRIAMTPLGRVEVYQKIGGPETGGKSPPGPHTHILPKLMRSGRTHSANVPVPEGLIPCLMMFPGNPLATAMGEDRSFDAGLHDGFEALMEKWGSPEQMAVKRAAVVRLSGGVSADDFVDPATRAGRVALRVRCRQLRADPRSSIDRRTLDLWRARFDAGAEPDDADETGAEGNRR